MSDDQMVTPNRVRQELGQAQIEKVLETQHMIRVGFSANEEIYVVPMGYVWYGGAFHGFTSHGRKVEMAQTSPNVAFSIDTSSRTGHWTWHSVAGEGTFEVIKMPRAALVMPKYIGKFNDAPGWFKVATAKEMAAGNLVAWRITPTSLTGRWLGSDTLTNEQLTQTGH